MRRALAISMLAALTLASAATATVENTKLASLTKPSSISAYHEIAVWDAYDPAQKTYFLTARSGSRVARLPVAPSKQGFGAQLGEGPDGSVWAVYSLCKKNRCTGYRYSFGDRKVAKLALPGAVWHNRLVTTHGTQLVVNTLAGKRLKAITSKPLDVRSSELVVWDHFAAYATDDTDTERTTVQLTDLDSGRTKQIFQRAVGESGFFWLTPSFARGSLYAVGACEVQEGCSGLLWAWSLKGHRMTRAGGGPDMATGFARSTETSYYVTAGADNSNQVTCTTPPAVTGNPKACDVVAVNGQRFKRLR